MKGLDQLLLATLITSNLMGSKSPFLQGHSERVAEYATLIAEEIEMTTEEIYVIRLTGLLHDIGKLAIPDNIITKKTAISAEERKICQDHVSIGVHALSNVPHIETVIQGVESHHERWDGKGYPKGLKGEEIPINGRIIAIADAFDAMMTELPYKKALSLKDCLIQIQLNIGTQFDPNLATIFAQRILRDINTSQSEQLPPAILSSIGVTLDETNTWKNSRVVENHSDGQITIRCLDREGCEETCKMNPGQHMSITYTVGEKPFTRKYRILNVAKDKHEQTCEPIDDAIYFTNVKPLTANVEIAATQKILSAQNSMNSDASNENQVIIRELGISTIAYDFSDNNWLISGNLGLSNPHRSVIGLEMMLDFHLQPVGNFGGSDVTIKVRIFSDPFHPLPNKPLRYRGEIIDLDPSTERIITQFIFESQLDLRRKGLI